MKLRLYHDTRKEFRDYVDAWSIYVPYPKWLREKEHGVFGCYLGCKPTENGIIRCTWEYDEITPGHGRPRLGKRVDIKTTSKAFQKIFRHYERLWNKTLKENTEKAWDRWNRA